MGGGAAPLRPRARLRPSLQSRDRRSRKPLPARRSRSRCRPASPATSAPAPAPGPARARKTCPTCNGAGRVRASQGGFFHIERTCPTCHGRGEVVSDPCTKCAGAGRVTQNAHALRQHPGRHRGRHAHPPRRRRRGGAARRPAGRPLHLPVDQAARLLPARRRRHLLPRPRVDDDGGARRSVRGADARRRPHRGEGAGGHADRPAVPPQGQGHAGAALAPGRATCMCRSW